MREETKQLVSLVDASKCDRLTDAVDQALKLIRFDFMKKIRKIAIKPNLCYYWRSSTGETTDPKVVEAIIDVFRMHTNPEDIYLVESDATVMRTRYAFKILGYEKLAAKKDIKLINLCEDALLPVNADTNIAILRHIMIPKTLTEADLFISVPTLKLHSLTGLSCVLKNQFGCVPVKRKVIFHKNIDEVIALINKLITPNLVLVDGIISKGRTPKRLDLIMAGNDPVAVDYVAAKIAGLNPTRIKHIIRSKKLGVGSTNVECVGEDWWKFSNSFPKIGFLYNLSRRSLVKLYYLYRQFTLEGRVFKLQPAEERLAS